ncbi:TetR family transcriptional regulator [Pseudoclavibacter endophyticus]|uniref:TetR/AcrR family transcriptional regulator n=1 Tax=Pseudoclavibacter endophyticus TaxID=1778590 RepID=A0A6H9WNC3_9MICO|nr:TetR/AcrR family transcriptional regulator [Pseudoclavibacter endophyticus]KAB1650366.1 TetR/AcrR family transcriptional regulator [Pseudoclavibacter endophyticus]GGA54780.1 TetR family transcriptional regulator [Pseudoclavibacter endophyticus]
MARKPYSRGIASQERILDTALGIVAKKGFGSTTLNDVAMAVEMTPAGLLHHFGSKENLYVEILRRRDVVDSQRLGPSGQSELPSTLLLARHNQTVPGLIHLYVNLAAASTDPKHPGHEYFRERYFVIQRRVARDIELRQADGRFDPAADPEEMATTLIALLDGLQARWDLDPSSVDMYGTLVAFWNRFVPESARVQPSAAATGASA